MWMCLFRLGDLDMVGGMFMIHDKGSREILLKLETFIILLSGNNSHNKIGII
jgi:hypothetical protein